jgi:hypothetical protein
MRNVAIKKGTEVIVTNPNSQWFMLRATVKKVILNTRGKLSAKIYSPITQSTCHMSFDNIEPVQG